MSDPISLSSFFPLFPFLFGVLHFHFCVFVSLFVSLSLPLSLSLSAFLYLNSLSLSLSLFSPFSLSLVPLSLSVFPSPQCGTIDYGSYVNLTERNLQDAQKFLLMHEVVQPLVPVPYFMEDNVRFSHLAVDVVQGKDMLFHIIYLATGTHCYGLGGLGERVHLPVCFGEGV